MIVVIDFACKGESHDIFNAGTIYQISKAFPNEEIAFLADKTHLDCVASLLSNEVRKGIRFERAVLDEIKYSDFFSKYVDFLSASKIVITSLNFDGLKYICEIMRERVNIQFIMLQHGQIEYLVDKEAFKSKFHFFRFYSQNMRMHFNLFCRYIDFMKKYLRDKKDKGKSDLFCAYMELCAELDNVKFVVFSDSYKKYTKKISSKVTSKFEKIDLPYVYDWGIEKEERNFDKIRIGLMPSTIEDQDELALRVIRWFNIRERRAKRKVEFIFFRHDLWNIKNVYAFGNEDFDRKNMNEFLKTCDFILLPFSRRKYKLSTSGTLFDAINMETPIIMGPSNSFNDFSDKKIGFRGFNVTEMGNIIMKIANELQPSEFTSMISNLQVLKKEMEEKNIERWVNILNGE